MNARPNPGLKRNRQPPPPKRYRAQCVHYPKCFGCKLIDRPYPEQLTIKQRLLLDAISAHPPLGRVEVPPVVPSPDRLRYRARVKLVVGQVKNQILTGLYMPETHQVIDISCCPVHPEAINRAVRFVKKNMTEFDLKPYDARSGAGQLRYLDFHYSFWRKEAVLTLVTKEASFPQGQRLARALVKRFPFIAGVLQNVNEDTGNVIWGKDFRLLAGRDTVLERIGFLKLKYPAGTFSQANPAVAQKLYETVFKMAALSGRERVLDLYCGVGPISLYLASAAREVLGIDESSVATAAARQNASLNGFRNCRFLAGDVAEAIAAVNKSVDPIDIVVVNPPRKGIRPDALALLVSLEAPTILYVSCNPVTLARDLVRFGQERYQIHAIQAFDMFPQTPEVETVALLKRPS